MPLVMMVVVIAGITVAYLHFAQGQATPAAAPTARPATASSSASPSLGPWQHITTRADDPKALSLAELFPPRYTAGGTVVRTIQRSGRNCPNTVLGNRLRAALRKAGCTQVMRASYLSAGQKIMATVGVLNLASVTDAEHAGKATGATAFIKQLPAAHGPTRNLMKGTGTGRGPDQGPLPDPHLGGVHEPEGPRQRGPPDRAGHVLPAAGHQHGRHQPDQPDGVR